MAALPTVELKEGASVTVVRFCCENLSSGIFLTHCDNIASDCVSEREIT